MSLLWETKMEREMEERYSEWIERQVMEQLNDYGIEFMPEDKSYREYKPVARKRSGVIGGVICAAVFWVPVLLYFWRTR